MLLITWPHMIIVTVGVWISMVLYDFLTLKLNIVKYEDEMQFAEKIFVAQNYNNTVLLNQYAKEKKSGIFQSVKKYRSCCPERHYKIPFFWSMPFLEQKEIRYILLIGSIFAVFQLTLQSMLR